MATNNILPFCPTDTGTNLLTQGDYAIAPDRSNGNQPGVASSKLVNKAMRQSAFISSQLAEFIATKTTNDVLDDGNTAKLLAVMTSALTTLPPRITKYTSGSGTHNVAYYFFIASGNATAAATYTNNGVTYTVLDTIASGTPLRATGSGAPAASGTLTKTGGTGDTTLTFYSVRAPTLLTGEMIGGGAGGSGSGTSVPTDPTAGSNTTFGAATAGGGGIGTIGAPGGAGGSASLGSYTGINIPGSSGGSACAVSALVAPMPGGNGGSGYFGGAGSGGNAGASSSNGTTATANSGAGGGGGGANVTSSADSGAGGGSGGYVRFYIPSPTSYSYAVGGGGNAGAAGTSGNTGGAGAAGIILLIEAYQ